VDRADDRDEPQGGAWGNGLAVAVGASGAILTSADGETWTLQVSGTTRTLEGATWGQGQYVVVGHGDDDGATILTSPDGVAWTRQASPTNNQLRALVAAGTELWAVGNTSVILHRTAGGLDFGDAPDPTYPTLLASDGARHTAGALYLGAGVDCEVDSQTTATPTATTPTAGATRTGWTCPRRCSPGRP
jgi:photosystem II stability/assembly factor-like uncharacterized protein